jgi:hypothetical protein
MSNRKIADIRNEVVAAQLKQLEEYFGEPVLPMSKYCEAFTIWTTCIINNNKDPKLVEPWGGQGKDYHDKLGHIMMDIRKSNLLARILYDKEEFRTEQCPEHKGHWSGNAMLMGNCPHACDGTGWLRAEKKK